MAYLHKDDYCDSCAEKNTEIRGKQQLHYLIHGTLRGNPLRTAGEKPQNHMSITQI